MKVTAKPVKVGVKLVTTKPRVVMALLLPVILPLLVSVAVRNWLPIVPRVTLKTPTPPASTLLLGTTTAVDVSLVWK